MLFWITRSIAWSLLHTVYFLFGGIRFEGTEHVPLQGGVLVTPNHISNADGPTIALALPRACWIMVDEDVFAMRVVGPLVKWLHGFPVKRYTADHAALRRAKDLLQEGEVVVIFPEGKLSTNGELQALLPGALLAARSANVPIIPTAIFGTDRILPYGKLLPRPAGCRIVVRFGTPVTVGELMGNIKGGKAIKSGAERLGAILRALQLGEPYPEFTDENLVVDTPV